MLETWRLQEDFVTHLLCDLSYNEVVVLLEVSDTVASTVQAVPELQLL